jgi:RNA polymerase sigma-70 factor (ECF subfamily)
MRTLPGTIEDQTVVRYFEEPGPDTYSALYRAVLGSLIGYFRTRGCGLHLAEDLAQHVMLAVYRHSVELRDPKRFYSWLFQIARNRLLQFRRDAQKEVDLKEIGDVAGPQRDPLAASEFEKWMSVLDEGEREVMMLRYIEGLKHHEIATALEIPIGTVQWRVFQATRKLAAHFGRPREMKQHGT